MKSQKRILYIHGGGDAIGGLETYLVNCLLNHKLYKPYMGVVKKGGFYSYVEQSGFKEIVDLKGGRLRELHKTLYAVFNGLLFVRRNSVDFIIAHGTHAWIYAWIISKLAGIKSIFYIQGVVKEKDFKRMLVGIGLRMKPDMYITNSKYSLSTVKKYLSNNSTYNYLASDISKFDEIDQESAKKKMIEEFGLDQDTFIFTIAGRIQQWKGQHLAIEAFKKINKNKTALLIIGDCTFEKDRIYLQRLEEMADNDPCIIFTGFRDDIPQIMCASDVILHCSTDPEPFGIVVVEGMMAKKVVIATSEGGPLEIIKHGEDGLLYSSSNVDQLAKLMDKVYEDHPMASRISVNAYNKSKDLFDIEVSVNSLENIITNLEN